MREELINLLERLGVNYVLGGYQTHPWSHMDSDAGKTCSAEVRMGPDEDDLEIELQMIHDIPPEDTLPIEQIMYMVAKKQTDDKWEIKVLNIKGESQANAVNGWQQKACKLFRECTRKLIAEEIPDFDELLQEIFKEDSKFGGSTGQGGGKQPKIRPNQLLDMKQGGSF